MTAENDTNEIQPDREQQLRQLKHDANNYLYILSMGLQALEGARNDPEDFAMVKKMLEDDGIAPLKQAINDVVDLAREKQD